MAHSQSVTWASISVGLRRYHALGQVTQNRAWLQYVFNLCKKGVFVRRKDTEGLRRTLVFINMDFTWTYTPIKQCQHGRGHREHTWRLTNSTNPLRAGFPNHLSDLGGRRGRHGVPTTVRKTLSAA